MHPAPSLAEAFPKTKPPADRIPYDPCRGDQEPALSPRERPTSLSPIRRTSDPLSVAGITELTDDDGSRADEAGATTFGAEASQSIFSVKDGAEIMQNRRASRRRTGPLSAQQREKAALIRKLGACADCRRRRVACSPHHHDMTWEDAIRKYRSTSPLQDLGSPPHHRPGSNIHRRKSSGESQRMDVDSVSAASKAVAAPTSRLPSSDVRIRTPLPSAPRLDKALSIPPIAAASPGLPPIPKFSSFRSSLEKSVSSILIPGRSRRYVVGHVLLVFWQDDDDAVVSSCVRELCGVLEERYAYKCEGVSIPTSKSEVCKNPSRWLSRHIDDFMEKHDSWDCLKIVYYIGFSFLDHAGDMVLSSSLDKAATPTIRWSGIQHKLEEACSDTLVIMDTAYFPSSRIARQKGVLEILAASTTEDYFRLAPRAGFTRLVLDRLRGGTQHQLSPRIFEDKLSTAELYSRVLFSYSELLSSQGGSAGGGPGDKHFSSNRAFPLMPLHIQISSNPTLPPITLTRMDSLQLPPLSAPSYQLSGSKNSGFEGATGSHGRQLSLTFRLTDDIGGGREEHDVERWRQWLMMMPEGVRSVKVDDLSSQLRT
ncbi:uncharacterized protein B0I36DRAFT_364867 [Microdochium trichocladiopsis]|uniref:Uncharacterized protein n=1 Tax=Microdochium trichocladiopsis TaxID=1682393 RepID=A0A9P8Y513_9PEZI|nr:uncharacterized protein B0I36DRAFT_364867 [Microdochium trichocladiopsis]KAH7027696.1 hypothetical protein B0I36DRAFT_364867 [Microdochium trichocladiopsis]